MATLTKELPQEMTHDFFEERRWLTIFSGFMATSSVAYNVYRYFIFLTIIYMASMAACACVFLPDKQLIITAIHFISISIYCTFWCVSFRGVHYSSLEKTRYLLKAGVYRYEDEDEFDEITNMRKEMSIEVRRKSNAFFFMYYSVGFITTTVFPLSQAVLLGSDVEEGVINPYMPYLFYQPFNTRDFKGTTIGYLLGNIIIFFLYTINCTAFWYYISGVVQAKIHFRILNHSIRIIPRRALFLYSKTWKLPTSVTQDSLLRNKYFQHCLYLSFRSNIQHHQALLRLRKYFEPFSSAFALCVVLSSPIVYGCLLYLLFQEHPINVTINIFLTFATEQCTVIFICFLGEDLITHSQQVFNSLYSTDWFKYDQRFKKILHIMMSNTIKPVGVKAMFLDVPASFETYSDVMSAMYKVTSIVRQSDLV